MTPDPSERDLRLTAAFQRLQAEVFRLAEHYSRREDPGVVHPMSLFNEVYLRLKKRGSFVWQSREHFIADAVEEMRRILVTRARERGADKRGGGWKKITLHDELIETQ